MANLNVKYNYGYNAVKVLLNEADLIGGDYQVYGTLTHEWGDVVSERTLAVRESPLHYKLEYSDIDLFSNGVYKLKWEVIIDNKTHTYYDNINVYTPYVSEIGFFDHYSYLDFAENDYQFDDIERKIRNIIHTFCGQKFEYFPDKSLSFDGTGGRSLYLPLPILRIEDVVASSAGQMGVTVYNEGENIEKNPESDWFIRWKSANGLFKPNNTYFVRGDWGWEYVPENVRQAAELLIAESMNDDNAYRQHGVTDLYMDTHRMRIDDKMVFNSTGVIDADVLLMDYIKYEFSWV